MDRHAYSVAELTKRATGLDIPVCRSPPRPAILRGLYNILETPLSARDGRR